MGEGRLERRLAAILAADVAGYSRLMGADEVGTLTALKSHRRVSMLGCVLGFGGYREEALERLQQAMRASPHDPLIWLWSIWRGLLQFFSRDFVAALQTLRQVARLRPGYAVTYEYIAASLAYLGRLDEAREVLERVPPQSAEQLQRWQQRPPWMRPEDYALRVEGVRLAAGERG
jgi:adenylate cyclase